MDGLILSKGPTIYTKRGRPQKRFYLRIKLHVLIIWDSFLSLLVGWKKERKKERKESRNSTERWKKCDGRSDEEGLLGKI